jgi:hypothetical protein
MQLSQVRKQALALEEVTEAPHHGYSSFRARGKIFITIPPDGEHIHVFVPVELQDEMVALYPDFAEKLFWGSKALGLRVHLPLAVPAVVRSLVTAAYEARVAKDAGPKTLRSSSKAR